MFSDPDFRKFFESAPSLHVVLSPEFNILAASDAYLEAAGTTRDKIIGLPFFDVFPGSNDREREYASELRTSLEKVLRTRRQDFMPPKRYDGARNPEDVRYWRSVSTPILNPAGQVTSIVRRVEDVTQNVLDEKTRHLLQEERDLFFSHSLDPLCIVGPDGHFKRVNSAFEKAVGYSSEELLSRPVVSFLVPEDVAETARGIDALAAGKTRKNSVNRYRCKDGTVKTFSWNTQPFGSLFFSVGRDITEQLAAEERIRNLNRELAAKNENLEQKIRERIAELQKSEAQLQQLQKMDAIGRLAGGIAHDFNNMLGAFSILCDLISDFADNPEFVRGKVTDLQNATDRAAALTRQLLIFSRKQIVQTQPVELNPLIIQLEKMLVRLISENVKLVTKLEPGLKNISADASQIEQVIMNLVVNARDAMPNGGTITIETENVFLDEEFSSTHLAVERGHYVQLTVTDNGTGMDAATKEKIFEPFFTTKPVGKGTGLGLSTTYGIVKQSKGSIWVYSEPGQGTVFKIYLPVSDKVTSTAAASPARLEVSGHFTVLVVEDDPLLREAFTSMLQRRGFHVLAAANGTEALEFCRSHKGDIHLLLTDIVMPGISGLQIARSALDLRPNLRVLYMSGYASDALENCGIDDPGELSFLQKPFGTNALVAKIQEILSLPNARR